MVSISFSIQSQDLIVTVENDSINCKIYKVKRDFIYFTFKREDEIRNVLINMSELKVYKFNFYNNSEVPEKIKKYKIQRQRFRLAINGGYSYRPGKIAKSIQGDLRKHYEELSHGKTVNVDLDYCFSPSLGLNFKHQRYYFSNEKVIPFINNNTGQSERVNIKNNQTTSFTGIGFKFRTLSYNKKNAFIWGGSFGNLTYTDEVTWIEDYKIHGNTFGMVVYYEYDIGITNNLSFGIQTSQVGGYLKKYDLSYKGVVNTIHLEESDYIGLGSFNLSFGFRFVFNST